MNTDLYPVCPVLLVDDEAPWLHSLALILKRSAGITNVITCQDCRQVIEILSRQKVSLVMLDLIMPHKSGEELLPDIVDLCPDLPVIILSGMNQVATAVNCIKLGASDYVIKTEEEIRIIRSVQKALSRQELIRENRRLKENFLQDRLNQSEAFSKIVTCSRKMRSLFQYLEAVSQSTEPILITGESGVGKELIAQAMHKITRPAGPWIAINVAGLDDNVFSDTLFGHRKGAFTGAEKNRPGVIERATGGTLFLDEIGDLNLPSQIKLLRLLQEGEYFPLGSDIPRKTDARIVVATNQDLGRKQAEGSFRKDLYFRLCTHHVHVPPLRERREDIPLLIDFFLKEAAQALGKDIPLIPRELLALLAKYDFPGNIRELRGMIYNALSLWTAGPLPLDTLRQTMKPAPPLLKRTISDEPNASWDSSFASLEQLPSLSEGANLLVAEAMRRSQGNQRVAASLLGISPQALNKRLNKIPSDS